MINLKADEEQVNKLTRLFKQAVEARLADWTAIRRLERALNNEDIDGIIDTLVAGIDTVDDLSDDSIRTMLYSMDCNEYDE